MRGVLQMARVRWELNETPRCLSIPMCRAPLQQQLSPVFQADNETLMEFFTKQYCMLFNHNFFPTTQKSLEHRRSRREGRDVMTICLMS